MFTKFLLHQTTCVGAKNGAGTAGTHDVSYSSARWFRNTWEKSQTGTRRDYQGRAGATGGNVRQTAECYRSVQVRGSSEPVSGSAGDQGESTENASGHGTREDDAWKEETGAEHRDRNEKIFGNEKRRTVSSVYIKDD